MLPSAHKSVPADINIHSTDEELVQFLEGRKTGDPTPNNVITGVNPFNFEPWNYPENIWYLYNSEGLRSTKGEYGFKFTRSGYWRQTDDLRILTSTPTIGRKTTLEFCEGKAPFGERTGWMMLEYQAGQRPLNGYNYSKDYSSLCRVFLQNDRISQEELNYAASASNSGGDYIEHLLLNLLEQEESNLSPRVSANSSQTVAGNDQVQSALSNRRPEKPLSENYAENIYGTCDFSKGEYLELNDLLHSPTTSSASSDNSSRMSVNSDEYFDPDSLLRDIENDRDFGAEENSTDCRFSMYAPVKSNQMVITLSPPDSTVNRNGDLANKESKNSKTASLLVRNGQTLHPGHSLSKDAMQKNGKACTASISHGSEANQIGESSHRQRTSQGNGSNSIHKIAKIGKKYCCFGPF